MKTFTPIPIAALFLTVGCAQHAQRPEPPVNDDRPADYTLSAQPYTKASPDTGAELLNTPTASHASAPSEAKARVGDSPRAFEEADTNGDDRLDRQEAQVLIDATGMDQLWDSDGDGQLTDPAVVDRIFVAWDRDHDGYVGYSEWLERS